MLRPSGPERGSSGVRWRWVLAALLVCAVLAPSAQAAGRAHQHGVARLDMAVDPGEITLQFSTPLDNLLGFERAPRTDAERAQVQSLVARLRAGETMWRIDPSAGCQLTGVTLASAVLKLGRSVASAGDAGHADLEGVYTFRCADTARAGHLDVGLFGFRHLHRVEVQVATARGQFRRDLKRPAQRIVLLP